jgi:electron transfer flavoprotein alpha subunit
MVLVLAEQNGGKFKKATLEIVTYGSKVAEMSGSECVALVIGESSESASLGKYGANKVLTITNASLETFDSKSYASAVAQVADKVGAKVIIVGHNSTGKSIVGRLAARMDAGVISGAKALPTIADGFQVEKNVFSGKGIASFKLDTDVKIISVMGNSIQPESNGSDVSPEAIDVSVDAPQVKVIDRKTVSGTVPLPEAELVVSAGRGMGAPDKWDIIEELADIIGATTACSRPVADTGWRPHHEHVGQTGVAIRPNLYFAIGISGAIQHLAGVSSSKVIVVINKDAEAPFFKNADYGIVGDLFDIVPKLNSALKEFKASNN